MIARNDLLERVTTLNCVEVNAYERKGKEMKQAGKCDLEMVRAF